MTKTGSPCKLVNNGSSVEAAATAVLSETDNILSFVCFYFVLTKSFLLSQLALAKV